MSCSTIMSECDSDDHDIPDSSILKKLDRKKILKSVSKDLLRNDLPYLVHNYSNIININDWITIKEILTHSNMCIFSIHSEGKYIFNITFINGKVLYINDKMITGNTIITKLPGNSYLIEIPSKNIQLQFTYGKSIRFRYCNKLHKYLTVVSRFYPILQSHLSS